MSTKPVVVYGADRLREGAARRVKSPKQVEVWPDLPRSKVGKILKAEIKIRLTQPAPIT